MGAVLRNLPNKVKLKAAQKAVFFLVGVEVGNFLLVGVLGIEPSLPAPKAGVLPVYDSPN